MQEIIIEISKYIIQPSGRTEGCTIESNRTHKNAEFPTLTCNRTSFYDHSQQALPRPFPSFIWRLYTAWKSFNYFRTLIMFAWRMRDVIELQLNLPHTHVTSYDVSLAPEVLKWVFPQFQLPLFVPRRMEKNQGVVSNLRLVFQGPFSRSTGGTVVRRAEN